jgi:hypothetical protein
MCLKASDLPVLPSIETKPACLDETSAPTIILELVTCPRRSSKKPHRFHGFNDTLWKDTGAIFPRKILFSGQLRFTHRRTLNLRYCCRVPDPGTILRKPCVFIELLLEQYPEYLSSPETLHLPRDGKREYKVNVDFQQGPLKPFLVLNCPK